LYFYDFLNFIKADLIFMRFNVPQFIEVEDKIFGPLTLKQFFMVIGAGILLFFLWYFFKLWFVFLFGIPLIGILVAEFFIKINGRPLHQVIAAWFSYISKPRIYIWKRKI